MKFESLARWEKTIEFTEEEKEQRRLKALMDGEEPNEVKIQYSYKEIVIDSKDIKVFNRVDDKHTTVRLYGGEVIVLAQPYEVFKEIFTQLSGEMINVFNITNAPKQNINEEIIEEEELDDENDFPINI